MGDVCETNDGNGNGVLPTRQDSGLGGEPDLRQSAHDRYVRAKFTMSHEVFQGRIFFIGECWLCFIFSRVFPGFNLFISTLLLM